MEDRKRTLYYVLLDFLSALLAWQIFNVFRFHVFRSTVGFSSVSFFLVSSKAVWMDALVPLFWLVIYYFSGYYADSRRKTNLGDFLNTFVSTFVGVLILFFLIVINDYPDKPTLYYVVAIGFFIIHFTCTWLIRFTQTARLLYLHTKGRCCVPILIIGTGENAKRVLGEFNKCRSNFAYLLKGFVRSGLEKDLLPSGEILGNIDQIGELISRYQVEELVFAIDNKDPDLRQQLLNSIYVYRIPVKAVASKQDIISGRVSLFSLFGIPMINLIPSPMPEWQKNFKFFFDYSVSFISLIVLSPFFLYFSIRIRLDSPGGVFYSQERVGKNGKMFRIYKFRTMFMDAEPETPLLSSKDDPRVTDYGRFLRKYRIDELPQFWNVFKGDMSIVGPRPERQFFVDKIVLKAPHYYLIQNVLPGITSWGMVKYGYANTVEKMIQRLVYDIIYLENQSILIDFKILVFTLKPLITGKGV